MLLTATASTNCFVSRTLGGKSTLVILELGYVKCFYWCQGLGDDLLCGKPLLHIPDCVEAPLHICVHGEALLHVLAVMNLGEAVSPYYIPWPRTAREGTKAPSNRFWKINHIFTSLYLTSDILHHQDLWIKQETMECRAYSNSNLAFQWQCSCLH